MQKPPLVDSPITTLGIEAFPDDVLRLIIQYLLYWPFKDFYNFSLTNKKINLISNSDAIWKFILHKLAASLHSNLNEEKILEGYENSKAMIKNLVFYQHKDLRTFSLDKLLPIQNKIIQFQYLTLLVNHWKNITSKTKYSIVAGYVSYIIKELIAVYDSKIFPSSLFVLFRFIDLILDANAYRGKLYNIVKNEIISKFNEVENQEDVVRLYREKLKSHIFSYVFGSKADMSNLLQDALLLPWIEIFAVDIEKAKEVFLFLYQNSELSRLLKSDDKIGLAFIECRDLTQFIDFLKNNKKIIQKMLDGPDRPNVPAGVMVLSKLDNEKRELFLNLYLNFKVMANLVFLNTIFSSPNILKNLKKLFQDNRLSQIAKINASFIDIFRDFEEIDYEKIDLLFGDLHKRYPGKISYPFVAYIYKHQLFTSEDDTLQEFFQMVNIEGILLESTLRKNLGHQTYKLLFSQQGVNLRKWVMSVEKTILYNGYEALQSLCNHPKSEMLFEFLEKNLKWVCRLNAFMPNASLFLNGIITYKYYEKLSVKKKGFLAKCGTRLDLWSKKEIVQFFSHTYSNAPENLLSFFEAYDGELSFKEVESLIESNVLSSYNGDMKKFATSYKDFSLSNLQTHMESDGKQQRIAWDEHSSTFLSKKRKELPEIVDQVIECLNEAKRHHSEGNAQKEHQLLTQANEMLGDHILSLNIGFFKS